MAESKGALIAKSVQKHAGRAKEKLLQNLGKVDRTLDDIFEEHLQNFNRQHQQATRLQKEFNNYIRCIRAVQTASKSLMEAITEAYESGWSGHDLLYVQAQNMEMLWQDFSHKLGDQVLIPLNTYTNQFPEVRKKVEKRGRKLVDYDSQRHSFQNLQSNAAKRRDDVKVTKGREQLEEAKRTYEVLNSELHDELPALYDSRVLFYVHNLQTLFSAEQLFHSETSKVYAELEAITDKLATDCQRGSYTKRNNGAPLPALPPQTLNGNAPDPTDTVQTPPPPRAAPPSPGWAPPDSPAAPTADSPAPAADSPAPTADSPAPTAESPAPATPPAVNGAPPPPARRDQDKPTSASDDRADDLYDIPVGSPDTPEKLNNNGDEKQVDVEQKQKETDNKSDDSQSKTDNKPNERQSKTDNKPNERQSKTDNKPNERQSKTDNVSNDNQSKTDEVYDIPVGATLAGLPSGALYRVRATYRYTREDADELSFDVGDLIRVVEYDDPDEQEEGWLMGIKETTNEKGMFPANFTRPI